MSTNKNYKVIKVTLAAHAKAFIEMAKVLYQNDSNWVQPLNADIALVFDNDKNKMFRNGNADRWILENKKGEIVGRIAAFFDKNTASTHSQPTGGVGFFECIDCQEAANLLFDTAKKWLEAYGMEAMDGPINFGERNNWWGLLIDGFVPPNYCCNYNPPYYKSLFENYGFKVFFNQFTYLRVIAKPLNPVVEAKAQRIYENKQYRFEHIKKGNLQKYVADFMEIYNKGWARFAGVKPMTLVQANALIKQIKPIMDEELIWFAYYENEPAGFFVMLPDLNQLIKDFNGKLNWYNKLKLYYRLKTQKVTKILGIIFGIVPEHQGKGLEAALIRIYGDIAWSEKCKYETIEMNWIGDFNPVMMRVAQQIGGELYKTHATYRYIFDRTIPFERAKRL